MAYHNSDEMIRFLSSLKEENSTMLPQCIEYLNKSSKKEADNRKMQNNWVKEKADLNKELEFVMKSHEDSKKELEDLKKSYEELKKEKDDMDAKYKNKLTNLKDKCHKVEEENKNLLKNQIDTQNVLDRDRGLSFSYQLFRNTSVRPSVETHFTDI